MSISYKIPGVNFAGGGGAFVSRETITGQTGTTLTFTTEYTLGLSGTSLYRNGSLMKKVVSPTGVLEYDEASTTTITLGVAAIAADEFDLVQFSNTGGGVSGLANRELVTGVSGVTATFTNAFVVGHQGNMVFRNGSLAKKVASSPTGALEYTEDNTTQITFGSALIAADEVDFYQFDRVGPAGTAVADIGTTSNLPASGSALSTGDTYTDAAVNSEIDAQINALISPLESRLDVIEAKIDELLASLRDSGQIDL